MIKSNRLLSRSRECKNGMMSETAIIILTMLFSLPYLLIYVGIAIIVIHIFNEFQKQRKDKNGDAKTGKNIHR